MEKIVSLCKRRGFIYPSSEIYGGCAGVWDYGPLGTELKRNLREAWWKAMTRDREDVVGLAKTTDAIAELKANGYKIFGIEQTQGSILLQDYQKGADEKIALIFGNEAAGVEQETLHQCDGCIEIPQLGMKHSLNISVAAGVVLWELAKELLKKNI